MRLDLNPVEGTLRRAGALIAALAFAHGLEAATVCEPWGETWAGTLTDTAGEESDWTLQAVRDCPEPPVEPPPIQPPEPPAGKTPSVVRDAPAWLRALTIPPGQWWRLPTTHRASSDDIRADLRCQADGNPECRGEDAAPWTGTGRRSLTGAWCGAAALRTWGDAGGIALSCGGHLAYGGSQLVALDLDTLRWEELTQPYGIIPGTDPRPVTDWFGQYPDGSRIPPHSLNSMVGIPGTADNPDGWYMSFQVEESMNLAPDPDYPPRGHTARPVGGGGISLKHGTWREYEHTPISSPWWRARHADPECEDFVDPSRCSFSEYTAATWYARARSETELGETVIVVQDPNGNGKPENWIYSFDLRADSGSADYVGTWRQVQPAPRSGYNYFQVACPLAATVEDDRCFMTNFNAGQPDRIYVFAPDDPERKWWHAPLEGPAPTTVSKYAVFTESQARGACATYYDPIASLLDVWSVCLDAEERTTWTLVGSETVDPNNTTHTPEIPGNNVIGSRGYSFWYYFEDEREGCAVVTTGGSICELFIIVPNSGARERNRVDCPATDPTACGYPYAMLIPATIAPIAPPRPEPPPNGDFLAKCEARDAIVCHDFLSQADVDEVYVPGYSLVPAVHDASTNSAVLTIPTTAEAEAADTVLASNVLGDLVEQYGALGNYPPYGSMTGELHWSWPVIQDGVVHFEYEMLAPELVQRAIYGKLYILWSQRSCGTHEIVMQPYRSNNVPHALWYETCGGNGYTVSDPFGVDNPSQIDAQPGGDTECLRHPDALSTMPCGIWGDDWIRVYTRVDLRPGGFVEVHFSYQTNGVYGDSAQVIRYPRQTTTELAELFVHYYNNGWPERLEERLYYRARNVMVWRTEQ